MPRSSITIRDVAEHAGVSHQTVSRVINASENVKPETRSKVEASINELGFRPNAIARFMARGRSQTLACISPNLTDFTFARIIEGAEIECRNLGYFLLSTSAPDEETFASLLDELITSRRTEGLLVINPFADGRYKLLSGIEPVVFVGARPREDAAHSVALDDVASGQDATQHLLDLGHRKIGMVTGPMVEDCTQDRQAGYRAALHDAGIEYDTRFVAAGDWSAISGYAAFKRIAAKGELPTAIFAQNDQMAVGVIRAAREAGLNVPNDLSVIGVDDMPLGSYFDPPLTTMRQDLFQIGRKAARLLTRALESTEVGEEQHLISAELVIRNSTTSFSN
ncbi:MAG: LacI family transcriptional regulator [Chloroflexi bacterium]|nr:MAG: LacI family transcriptional regulator [Chloroflexota bacterium]MBL1196237.1 LacI family transcriptional regulator [Chloroflexota bacterium]NOH13531.1 LacI family DNA-binding transcriptional regulator [Chloroflexota bacterium]